MYVYNSKSILNQFKFEFYIQIPFEQTLNNPTETHFKFTVSNSKINNKNVF